MLRGSHQGEKFDAQKYCFKDLATEHLKEKSRCADKADHYVDFVFETCIADKAPFAPGGQSAARLAGITGKIL